MEQTQGQSTPEAPKMSVIGGGITITGNIEAEVDLQIAGEVNGDVRCAKLVLEPDSVIRGSVVAERAHVSGTIEGAIETQDLAVEASARVKGDVTYSRIRISNGGIVDGKMTHRPSEEAENGRLRLVEPTATSPKPKAGKTVHIE